MARDETTIRPFLKNALEKAPEDRSFFEKLTEVLFRGLTPKIGAILVTILFTTGATTYPAVLLFPLGLSIIIVITNCGSFIGKAEVRVTMFCFL